MEDRLTVLFATDFSPNARKALHFLTSLQQAYNTDIFLIHVIPSFWKNWLTSGLYQKEALQRLTSWQQELSKKSEPKKLAVETGNRADLILAKATTSDVDLIVMGGKDPQTKGRYKSGATSENVVRNAKKSVLICKNQKTTKILCGIDGSLASTKALTDAIKFAKHFNAKLIILSVIPKITADALGMDQKDILKEEEKAEKENIDIINEFLEPFDFSDINVEKQFKWGTPSHVILDMAEDFEYELIVIGAKGQSMLQHVLIGSTAEKILRFAPCSLLVAR